LRILAWMVLILSFVSVNSAQAAQILTADEFRGNTESPWSLDRYRVLGSKTDVGCNEPDCRYDAFESGDITFVFPSIDCPDELYCYIWISDVGKLGLGRMILAMEAVKKRLKEGGPQVFIKPADYSGNGAWVDAEVLNLISLERYDLREFRNEKSPYRKLIKPIPWYLRFWRWLINL